MPTLKDCLATWRHFSRATSRCISSTVFRSWLRRSSRRVAYALGTFCADPGKAPVSSNGFGYESRLELSIYYSLASGFGFNCFQSENVCCRENELLWTTEQSGKILRRTVVEPACGASMICRLGVCVAARSPHDVLDLVFAVGA